MVVKHLFYRRVQRQRRGQKIGDRERNSFITGQFRLKGSNCAATAYVASSLSGDVRRKASHVPGSPRAQRRTVSLRSTLDQKRRSGVCFLRVGGGKSEFICICSKAAASMWAKIRGGWRGRSIWPSFDIRIVMHSILLELFFCIHILTGRREYSKWA